MSLTPFIQRIDQHFEALSPELQRAARWVREHPTALGLQSMRQSAQAAGVAPATMTRLAQALGLSGFAGLRAPAVAHLTETSRRASPLNAVLMPSAEPSGLTDLVQAQARNLTSIERNPPEVLTAAAQAVLDRKSVV